MSIFDEKKLRKLFSENNICINLVGILYEKNKKKTHLKIYILISPHFSPSYVMNLN